MWKKANAVGLGILNMLGDGSSPTPSTSCSFVLNLTLVRPQVL